MHSYAIWHLLRRLRGRTGGGAETTYAQLVGVRRHVRAAISLLDWLAARDLTLATARQGDLDSWIASGGGTGCREAGHFVRWATKHKLASLDFPATWWSGPASAIDAEARWEQARQLLHDDTLKPDDRVAGLLVLLYAQWPSGMLLELLLGALTCDDGQWGEAEGIGFVRVPGPVQVVNASGRSLDLPRASGGCLLGTECAGGRGDRHGRDPRARIRWRAAGAYRRRDPPRHDLTPAAMRITARRPNAQATLAGFATNSVT